MRYNKPDHSACNAELAGDFELWSSVTCKPSNIAYVTLRKFTIWVRFTLRWVLFSIGSYFPRMVNVLLACTPLKVVNPIVGLYSILMVNFWESFRIWYKCVSNKPMNLVSFTILAPTNRYRHIPVPASVGIGRQPTGLVSLIYKISITAFDSYSKPVAVNTSVVRNRVFSSLSWDIFYSHSYILPGLSCNATL